MDEIDSSGSTRMESGTGNGDSEVQRTMLELLNQLDGLEASNKIKVCWYLACDLASLVLYKSQFLGILFSSVLNEVDCFIQGLLYRSVPPGTGGAYRSNRLPVRGPPGTITVLHYYTVALLRYKKYKITRYIRVYRSVHRYRTVPSPGRNTGTIR